MKLLRSLGFGWRAELRAEVAKMTVNLKRRLERMSALERRATEATSALTEIRSQVAILTANRLDYASLESQIQECSRSAESRIQKRLRAQLRYWLERQTRIPNIIVQDELQPEIGTEYTLVELQPKDGSPIMLGGNMNLVNLSLGDVVVIACVCTDHKGSKARFFNETQRGPLEDPYFILEPLVITSGTKVVFQATQGHSRPFTYTFYRW